MQTEPYIIYLETLLISLINERNNDLKLINDSDPEAPLFAKDNHFCPIRVRELIERKRLLRKEPNPCTF